jgi:hypothetical protein
MLVTWPTTPAQRREFADEVCGKPLRNLGAERFVSFAET